MEIVVIVLVLLAVAVMIFKKPSSFVYYICSIDILLRVLSFLADNLPLKFLTDFIHAYFPRSVDNIIAMYTSGIFSIVLVWILAILYVIFDVYVLKTLWKKG